MPELDPARYPFARLVVAEHRLPFGARFFGDVSDHPGYERVDTFDGFVQMLLTGRSIELADPPATSPAATDDPAA